MANPTHSSDPDPALLALYHQLVEQMRPRADHYLRTYHHVLPAHLEPEDLVQEAALAMYLRLSHAATLASPAAYLAGTGYRKMYHHCVDLLRRHDLRLESLDAPIDEESDTLLRDVIPAAALKLEAPPPEPEYAPLSQAIEALAEADRAILAHHLGLLGRAPCPFSEIARRSGTATRTITSRSSRILTQLYFRLKGVYPHYANGVLARHPRAASVQAQLEEAVTRLQEQGLPLSVPRLQQGMSLSHATVAAFLRERQGEREKPQQRLARAYAACPNPDTLGVAELARLAVLLWTPASRYLKAKRGQRQVQA